MYIVQYGFLYLILTRPKFAVQAIHEQNCLKMTPVVVSCANVFSNTPCTIPDKPLLFLADTVYFTPGYDVHSVHSVTYKY
jgi:hypothetical protein